MSHKPRRCHIPRRLYDEHIQALDTVLRLIDGILADTSPLLGLPEDHPDRQIKHLQEAKVTLSILVHLLRSGLAPDRRTPQMWA